MEERLCQGCLTLRRRVEEIEAEKQRLLQLLEAERRSGKRQAAPFSKGARKDQPKKPGRKSGNDYGNQGHRPPPPPEKIDDLNPRRFRANRLLQALQRLIAKRSFFRSRNGSRRAFCRTIQH